MGIRYSNCIWYQLLYIHHSQCWIPIHYMTPRSAKQKNLIFYCWSNWLLLPNVNHNFNNVFLFFFSAPTTLPESPTHSKQQRAKSAPASRVQYERNTKPASRQAFAASYKEQNDFGATKPYRLVARLIRVTPKLNRCLTGGWPAVLSGSTQLSLFRAIELPATRWNCYFERNIKEFSPKALWIDSSVFGEFAINLLYSTAT